jgi:hypothetical protein
MTSSGPPVRIAVDKSSSHAYLNPKILNHDRLVHRLFSLFARSLRCFRVEDAEYLGTTVFLINPLLTYLICREVPGFASGE